MEASKGLQIVADFKGQNLKQNLNVLRADLIGKGKNQNSKQHFKRFL